MMRAVHWPFYGCRWHRSALLAAAIPDVHGRNGDGRRRRVSGSSQVRWRPATAVLRAWFDLPIGRTTAAGWSRLRLWMQQQIDRGKVRDHEQRNINHRDRVGRTQMAGQLGKAQPDAVVVIDDEVGDAHETVGKDKR